MASTSSYNPGSKPFISGYPAAVTAAEGFLDSIDDLLSDAIDQATRTARSDIRDVASRDEAWAPFADLLDVEYQNGEFHYVLSGDPDRVEQALELEYGTESTPPNSILRKAAIRQAVPIGQRVATFLNEENPLA